MKISMRRGPDSRLVFMLVVACAMHAAAGMCAAAAPAAADVAAVKTRLEALGKNAKHKLDGESRMTEISIEDGAELTFDDVALIGRLDDLRSLRILNCRILNDEMVAMGDSDDDDGGRDAEAKASGDAPRRPQTRPPSNDLFLDFDTSVTEGGAPSDAAPSSSSATSGTWIRFFRSARVSASLAPLAFRPRPPSWLSPLCATARDVAAAA
jgi:hypothetical protein